MTNRRRQRIMHDEAHQLTRRLTAGPIVRVPDERTNQWPDPAPGEHVWAMYGMWRIEHPETAFDSSVPKFLDLENLLTLTGPGCFVCEQVWTEEIGAAPCPGDPHP